MTIASRFNISPIRNKKALKKMITVTMAFLYVL
ncbi:MAG: hypothetical protein ACI9US_001187, partial [Gammaproteobacteria bacterium]